MCVEDTRETKVLDHNLHYQDNAFLLDGEVVNVTVTPLDRTIKIGCTNIDFTAVEKLYSFLACPAIRRQPGE